MAETILLICCSPPGEPSSEEWITPKSPPATAATARFIARCLLAASQEGRYTALGWRGDGDRYRRLLTVAGGERFVCAADNGWFRRAFPGGVDFLLPGIVAHYLARKRCLDDWLRASACQQAVLLGAGLDTLAWRESAAHPDVRFVEVDRLAALCVKAWALGPEQPPNLTFLPADLTRESLAQVLERDRGFDPTARTLFVAEGLFMYLPPARVHSLLEELARSGGPRVLAFSFMEARGDGLIGFRRSGALVDGWLRWQGEPFRWSISPEKVAAFLARAGWLTCELVSADSLRRRYLTPAGLRDAPLAVGEWLALAQTL